jgi:hypothetical protein
MPPSTFSREKERGIQGLARRDVTAPRCSYAALSEKQLPVAFAVSMRCSLFFHG